jgi:hypothetical protein
MSFAPKPLSISAIAISIALATMAWPTIVYAQAALMTKLKDCLLIEDGYKERLDCYDAVIPPDPKPNAKKPKVVTECRFLKEQDERLACYNRFVNKKSPPPPAAKPPAKKKTPLPPIH